MAGRENFFRSLFFIDKKGKNILFFSYTHLSHLIPNQHTHTHTRERWILKQSNQSRTEKRLSVVKCLGTLVWNESRDSNKEEEVKDLSISSEGGEGREGSNNTEKKLHFVLLIIDKSMKVWKIHPSRCRADALRTVKKLLQFVSGWKARDWFVADRAKGNNFVRNKMTSELNSYRHN